MMWMRPRHRVNSSYALVCWCTIASIKMTEMEVSADSLREGERLLKIDILFKQNYIRQMHAQWYQL